MFLKNALGEEICTYCLLDSDYHTAEALLRRYEEAQRVGVRLHIWERKEIENYLLVPTAIQRAIVSGVRVKSNAPTKDETTKVLETIAEEQKDLAFDAISQEALREQGQRNKICKRESEKENR